jgi:ubiquinol-cytochrome c reductase iron-sulfur subunit
VPGRALFETTWRPGRRLATPGGEPVSPDTLPVGGVLTVFPDGDDADPNAATLLIRVEPELLRLPAERAAWAPDGFVAYSKLCTHAGCPVGLFRAAVGELFCPCHQSKFDVFRGAEPIGGPTTRALPQLALGTDDEGYLVSLRDFDEPVGPGFWNMRREAGDA